MTGSPDQPGVASVVSLEAMLAQRSWVRRVARALAASEADADDLEQEAWVRALENRPVSEGGLRGWFRTVLRRSAIDQWRSETRRQRREEALVPPGSAVPTSDLVAEADLHRRVVDTVMDLKEPYRAVIVLHYFHELSAGEIALRDGLPLETVRTRLRRGRALLRDMLGPRLGIPTGGTRDAWCLALAPLLGDGSRGAATAGSIAGTSATVGGVLMAQQALAVAVATLVAGAGIGWWASSRGGPGSPRSEGTEGAGTSVATVRPGSSGAVDSPDLAARVARLQAEVERQSNRIARLEGSVTSLDARVPAADGTPPADPARDRKRVLEELKAITEGEQQLTIQERLKDLVRIGDPAVPDIVSTLDTGFERDYGGGFSTGGNAVKSYGSLRMVLLDALRQIGSSSAKEGLLGVVGKSGRLSDSRDLLLLYPAASDPALVTGISALVPGILKRVAEVGVEKAEKEATMIVHFLVTWIRKHEMTETMDAVADIVVNAPAGPAGAGSQIQGLFGLLVEFAPEKAVQVARRLQEGDPDQRALQSLSFGLRGPIPLARLARYYELLFSQMDLSPSTRSGLYISMPGMLCREIDDPTRRAEDGKALVTFLEGRLGAETDPQSKASIDRVLTTLRQAITQAQKK